MKRPELDELLRLITRQVLKEYSTMASAEDSESDDSTSGIEVQATDAMTSVEKQKAERDAKKKRVDQIRTADLDLKGTKTQQDYFIQQAKKNKEDIRAKEKKLQQMKGGASTVVPAGGTIAELIQKIK